MNIRINDKEGKVTYGAMYEGNVVQLHSGLKAAVLVLKDIWRQEYPDQGADAFKEQLITAFDME